jgi:hypothetical protein
MLLGDFMKFFGCIFYLILLSLNANARGLISTNPKTARPLPYLSNKMYACFQSYESCYNFDKEFFYALKRYNKKNIFFPVRSCTKNMVSSIYTDCPWYYTGQFSLKLNMDYKAGLKKYDGKKIYLELKFEIKQLNPDAPLDTRDKDLLIRDSFLSPLMNPINSRYFRFSEKIIVKREHQVYFIQFIPWDPNTKPSKIETFADLANKYLVRRGKRRNEEILDTLINTNKDTLYQCQMIYKKETQPIPKDNKAIKKYLKDQGSSISWEMDFSDILSRIKDLTDSMKKITDTGKAIKPFIISNKNTIVPEKSKLFMAMKLNYPDPIILRFQEYDLKFHSLKAFNEFFTTKNVNSFEQEKAARLYTFTKCHKIKVQTNITSFLHRSATQTAIQKGTTGRTRTANPKETATRKERISGLLYQLCAYTTDFLLSQDLPFSSIEDFAPKWLKFKKAYCENKIRLGAWVEFNNFNNKIETIDQTCFKLHLSATKRMEVVFKNTIYPTFLKAFAQLKKTYSDTKTSFKILKNSDLNNNSFSKIVETVLGVPPKGENNPDLLSQQGKFATIYFNLNEWKYIPIFLGLVNKYINPNKLDNISFVTPPYEKTIAHKKWHNKNASKMFTIRYGVCNASKGGSDKYTTKVYEFDQEDGVYKLNKPPINVFTQNKQQSFPDSLTLPKQLKRLIIWDDK